MASTKLAGTRSTLYDEYLKDMERNQRNREKLLNTKQKLRLDELEVIHTNALDELEKTLAFHDKANTAKINAQNELAQINNRAAAARQQASDEAAMQRLEFQNSPTSIASKQLDLQEKMFNKKQEPKTKYSIDELATFLHNATTTTDASGNFVYNQLTPMNKEVLGIMADESGYEFAGTGETAMVLPSRKKWYNPLTWLERGEVALPDYSVRKKKKRDEEDL